MYPAMMEELSLGAAVKQLSID